MSAEDPKARELFEDVRKLWSPDKPDSQANCLHRLVRPITLFLVLTHHWYDQTESGAKRIEYRAMTERWKRQIWDRRESITAVRFARGYTSRTLTRSVERIDIGPCPIPGWAGDYYRIHFSHA